MAELLAFVDVFSSEMGMAEEGHVKICLQTWEPV
jgi:hypothetical protein